jgi:hypothetical protein
MGRAATGSRLVIGICFLIAALEGQAGTYVAKVREVEPV